MLRESSDSEITDNECHELTCEENSGVSSLDATMEDTCISNTQNHHETEVSEGSTVTSTCTSIQSTVNDVVQCASTENKSPGMLVIMFVLKYCTIIYIEAVSKSQEQLVQ